MDAAICSVARPDIDRKVALPRAPQAQKDYYLLTVVRSSLPGTRHTQGRAGTDVFLASAQGSLSSASCTSGTRVWLQHTPRSGLEQPQSDRT